MKTTDSSVSFTKEATTGDVGKTRYTIDDDDMRYWDKATVPSVYLDDVLVTTGYSIEYAGGVIVFDDALTTEVVTVSGKYWTLAEVAGIKKYSIDIKANTVDVTTFASNGWKENVTTVKEFTVSCEGFWQSEDISDRLGEEVVLKLFIDDSAALVRYEGFANLTSDKINCAVDTVIEESLEFTGTGSIFYREG